MSPAQSHSLDPLQPTTVPARAMEFVAVGVARGRPKPNPHTAMLRGFSGCRLVFAVKCWIEFEVAENRRVPLELRVRALPDSCAVCAFAGRATFADAYPSYCVAVQSMMPNPSVDIGTYRAGYCPLVVAEGAALVVDECPAWARIRGGDGER